MKRLKALVFMLLIVSVIPLAAQKRDINLTVNATCATGESLEGQEVEVFQADYSLYYEKIYLDAAGTASIKVYPGNNRVTIKRSGFKTFTRDFDATADLTVDAELVEDVQTPFSLTADVRHDVFTGDNGIAFSWNREKPVFSDNFEGYDPFSIQFGEWTGIDGDGIAAAPLVGEYQNRGALMYAQIINPLKVVPSWWADYPVLRPYSGQQYVGFIRTTTGAANDDWLISPVITPGNLNFLTFMAKAADVGKERFQVYVTEKTDNPEEQDFTQINTGNYEQVDYKAWKKFSYSLSGYAGKPIRFAIRYISTANTERTFMLMIDDVEVAQDLTAAKSAARRVPPAALRSPQNPNETFEIYLDNDKVGTTDGYDYTFSNISEGTHVLGVKAVYKQAQSDMATTEVSVSNQNNVHYTLNIATNNGQSLDGKTVSITDVATGGENIGTIAGGKVDMKSLPKGEYLISAAIDNYESYEKRVTVSADGSLDVELKEKIIAPYNVTAETTADGKGAYNVALRWNQDLAFTDDFESYPDFAQGSFGQWKSVDLDGGKVYPIGLGSQTNIVTFPGASTPSSPTAIAPIVFNAYKTTPAMLPTDPAMTPTSGEKEIVFFSPQGKMADKWLISPQLDIRDGYVLRVAAKAYASLYPESLEFCVSTTDAETTSFTVVSNASTMSADQWTVYETDLSRFAGQKVYIGVHYVTYDGFFAQLDDFYVGSEDGKSESANVGAVKGYDVYLDGAKQGTSAEAEYTLTGVAAGSHKAGIRAQYASGMSELTEYDFTAGTTSVGSVAADAASAAAEYFTIDGRKLGSSHPEKGVYIRKSGSETVKVVVR